MEEKLRHDFPVDWDEDHYVSRREFFKFMTLTSGGLALGSTALAAWSRVPRDHRAFEPVAVAKVTDLSVGRSIGFSYPRPDDLCILIQTGDGEYKAYSRRCTHLSCPVEYQADQARLYCPCHNGAFALKDGSVLQGPPPRPLPEIIVEVRGDQIFAKGIKRGEAA
ncbi:MAG: ubiquinol-cytochrome c reductase iron-sulfur subunit [Fimbriimonas sp.]